MADPRAGLVRECLRKRGDELPEAIEERGLRFVEVRVEVELIGDPNVAGRATVREGSPQRRQRSGGGEQQGGRALETGARLLSGAALRALAFRRASPFEGQLQRKRISGAVLRRRKEEVLTQLPALTEQTRYTALTPVQRELEHG